MTPSKLITRITILLIAAGVVLSGSPKGGRDAQTSVNVSRRRAYSFADVTRRAGLSDATRTWGSTWNDYNEDGRADLWIGRHWRQPRLFSNLGGGRFEENESEDFRMAEIDRHACVWGEANGDGRADIYCVRGADKGIGSGANQLFIQDRMGTFTNKADGRGVSNPNGRGRTANWLDYDGDGDLDLFVGNLTRPAFPNAMFRNDGDMFTQVEVGLSAILKTVSSSWADWDLDGDPDLLVLQHSGEPAIAYENVSGLFRSVDLPNVSGQHWNSAAWDDFDGDGRPDVHLVSLGRSHILRNTRSGFEVVDRMTLREGRMSTWLDVDNDSAGRHPAGGPGNQPDFLLVNTKNGFRRLQTTSLRGPKAGNGDAVSASDYDRDGRVDLFITNGLFYWTGPNVLLQNRSVVGNWVGVDLDGDLTNPMGFGATVTARIKDRKVQRQITDGANYRSQNEAGYLHLGLADATTAQLHIRWPDGTSDCTLAAAGLVVEVVKGSSPCLLLH
jgi:hypothetical protein